MKFLQQNLNNGKISLENGKIPDLKNGQVLIKTSKTLISSGTERMMLEFGKSNIISKINNNKDKINLLFDKIKTSGLFSTLELVKDKLYKPIQIGYSNVGIVEKSKSNKFNLGDRVVSNGFHAEYVNINENLCCKVPNNVSDNDAVFSILGSIALNGIRKINPQINENIVIYGYGLIGNIASKILDNTGANIIIVDINEDKRSVAKKLGYNFINPNKENIEDKINIYTNNHGVDSILICTYTNSEDPINISSKIIRKRGKIILIGSCGLNFSRKLMYDKEATFQVSKSYGPGRYEYLYEQKNYDFPIEFIRWTLNRNIESILNLIKKKKINFNDLIDFEYDINSYEEAYEKILSQNNLKGIILNFSNLFKNEKIIKIDTQKKNKQIKENLKSLSCLGAGNQCKNILLPIFKKNKAEFNKIYTPQNIDKLQLKNKFNFKEISKDENEIFENKKGFVVISTPHNLHSQQIQKAINKSLNVFIEKPIAINQKQITELLETLSIAKDLPIIFCNFNRRYSSFSKSIKDNLNYDVPKKILIDVNSPKYGNGTNWVSDYEISGGPIIGEACHFIDLAKYYIEKKIVSYDIKSIDKTEEFTIYLEFEDNSTAIINYMFSGNKKYPKEKIKIFSGGTVLSLDNFAKLDIYTNKKETKKIFFGQDKGHENSIKNFLNMLEKKQNNLDQILDYIDTTKITVNLKNNC